MNVAEQWDFQAKIKNLPDVTLKWHILIYFVEWLSRQPDKKEFNEYLELLNAQWEKACFSERIPD